MAGNSRTIKSVAIVCFLIVLSIYITGSIQYSFENYVFTNGTIFDQVLTGIVSMVSWASILTVILFALSKVFPPFGQFFLKWFNVDTEAETATNPENQQTVKRSRKKPDWEKYTLVISIIGLVVTSVLTAGLTAYSFVLTDKATDIAQKSLDLQTYQPLVVPNTAVIYLDKGYAPDYLNQSEADGWFNFSITVLTPIGGILSVKALNYSTDGYDNFLLPEKANKTEYSTEEFQYSNHDQVIDSGLNQKSYSIPLKLYYYPDFSKLQDTGTSSEYIAIGTLYLRATFRDVAGNIVVKDFSEMVVARTVIPNLI